MDRNRIEQFLVDLASDDHGTQRGHGHAPDAPRASLAPIPQAIWDELALHERAKLASIYQRAFQQAEAQYRRACVERLLASITTR